MALIGLVYFQSKWLNQARNLIEEQFNQKVSMALCMAVTDLSEGPKSCLAEPDNAFLQFLLTEEKRLEQRKVKKALDEALAFYDIHTAYNIEILDRNSSCLKEGDPGCCSMSAVAGFENDLLNITFPGRNQYVLKKMGFMIGSSVLILLFITFVFYMAVKYLKQQQELGERNKDFFNNMAHEFKTPLTNIKLATHLLTKKEKGLSDNAYVSVLRKESQKLMQQVERVLYLANLEKGQYQLQKEQLNLKNVMDNVVDEMSIQIQEKGGIVNIQIEEDLSILGDAFHLSNAFRNLIDNALKYADDQPEITISSSKQKDGILLLFQDNGMGISKSDQQIIFDKFQRVSNNDVHNQKGFGLGLAYVKKVVELHKGFIKVFSELNKGSRFDLFFPIG